MFRINPIAVVLAMLVFSAGAEAQAEKGKIELKAVAEIEIEVPKENGEVELRRVPAKLVVPGDDVIYTITATNISKASVEDVVIVDPVPDHMTYRDGSAIGSDTEITFSVDSGVSFDLAANLRVIGEDGKLRAAVPEDYTHIRWKFTQELPSGSSKFVRFRAQLQ